MACVFVYIHACIQPATEINIAIMYYKTFYEVDLYHLNLYKIHVVIYQQITQFKISYLLIQSITITTTHTQKN